MGQSILILGGGFGGIAAANTLRRVLPRDNTITVLDRTPRFLVGAGKTWVMLGERTVEEISQSRAALLEPGVRLVQGEALGLDLRARTAQTDTGELRWDYLIIALGAELNSTAVPGLATSHTFYTLEGAQRLQPVLAEFTAGDVALLIPKTPFKCPAAPYEAALMLQRFFADRGLGAAVRLALYTVEGAPMATGGPDVGAFVRAELAAKGIGYFTQKNVSRVDVEARRIEFADGSCAPADLLIHVPPHEAPAIVREAKLTNPAGWVPVDPFTLEVQHADAGGRVFAAGDITSVPLPGRFKPDVLLSLPKAGVMAEAHGIVAAQHIAARIFGLPTDAKFDGRGFCYLETGGGIAVKAEGNFFALPHPVMKQQPPDAKQFAHKLDWVRHHLAPVRR
ncbi:MAG: NAD(P)/FAD-dependent oxidoreductase [Opitutus sp.]|nr:NAD(P)/FAD-dependent oxidoreductase [Opitutus sp.]